jgi:DNA-binding NarL/FixJ family response regulator
MSRYINHDAIADVFLPVSVEINPRVRLEMLRAIQSDIGTRILEEQERIAFELKSEGDSTGQIADDMAVSERAVKRWIGNYAAKNGLHNLLHRRKASNVVDIRDRVARRPGNRQG